MPEDYQSIMTYLNLADDYFKEKESAKAQHPTKESMEKETYRLKHEIGQHPDETRESPQ